MMDTETGAPSIPDHELLGCVGRGSYGEVWLARSVTGAYRAVKIVHRRSFSSDRPYDREFNGILKFEPVSRTHPGLVSILHVGRNNEGGYFYYVMEVADDAATGRVIDPVRYVPKTLGAWLRDGALPLRECIRVGLMLSDALGHLHGANLVHRDLKPSNIIFVEGAPKLADIGLVTDIGEQATYVGTEGYIAPEGPGSPGADLYSLGKVLYEMSTGMRCDAFPELPMDFRLRPDAELFARMNAVVLRACDARASHRQGTARELHLDISALASEQFTNAGGGTADEPRAGGGLPRAMIVFEPNEARDGRVAALLEERAAAAGWKVVLNDPSDFGVAWARRFEKEAKEARAIVVLVSEATANDAVVNYQLDVAVREAGRADGPKLLLVRLGYEGGLPGVVGCALEGWPTVSSTEEGDDERMAGEVAQQLTALLSAAGTSSR